MSYHEYYKGEMRLRKIILFYLMLIFAIIGFSKCSAQTSEIQRNESTEISFCGWQSVTCKPQGLWTFREWVKFTGLRKEVHYRIIPTDAQFNYLSLNSFGQPIPPVAAMGSNGGVSWIGGLPYLVNANPNGDVTMFWTEPCSGQLNIANVHGTVGSWQITQLTDTVYWHVYLTFKDHIIESGKNGYNPNWRRESFVVKHPMCVPLGFEDKNNDKNNDNNLETNDDLRILYMNYMGQQDENNPIFFIQKKDGTLVRRIIISP